MAEDRFSDNELFSFIGGSATGESTFDIWKSLGYEGDRAEFLEFMKVGLSDIDDPIIDVTELPTENINEFVFYRLTSGSLLRNGATSYGTVYCVNELPEVGEAFNYNSSKFRAYYNISDNSVYGYVTEELSTEFSIDIGWHSFSDCMTAKGSVFNGVITHFSEASDDYTYRLLLMHDLYIYKNSIWINISAAKKGIGAYSIEEGRLTIASGTHSHAEGYQTTASGNYSHAEGFKTNASGNYSHAEGYQTIADKYAHAEGSLTKASGNNSHAEGTQTIASGNNQHVEGKWNIDDVDAEGNALNTYAHIVGNGTTGNRSNAYTLDWEGNAEYQGDVKANACGGENPVSLVETHNEIISKAGKKVEEGQAVTIQYGILEGTQVTTGTGAEIFNRYDYNAASGKYSHAEGSATAAIGDMSHAEGTTTNASGNAAHTEGSMTLASGNSSHAEGSYSKASGTGSHAEGNYTKAVGDGTHTEGFNAKASGTGSHAEGTSSNYIELVLTGEADALTYTVENEIPSGYKNYLINSSQIFTMPKSNITEVTIEGDFITKVTFDKTLGQLTSQKIQFAVYNTANGNSSHVEGYNTLAFGDYQHVQGKANIPDFENKYAHIVGNGEISNAFNPSVLSNAHTLDWQGNAWYQGDVYVGGTSQDDENATKLIRSPKTAQVGQTLVVKAVDENGMPIEWETVNKPTNVSDLTNDIFGGTVEITSGEPTKEQTVLTLNPDVEEEISVYSTEEIDNKTTDIQQQIDANKAEIIDARTDKDGVTYENIGAHIRAVISQLYEEINALRTEIGLDITEVASLIGGDA